MNDLVSVVVPVYKVEDVIINTLKSIAAQTYKNIEVVIVDDGTPDRSAVVAEEFLVTTELNWKIIHKENGGLAAARNTGIENSSGTWVICPDSDDVIEPQTIEVMLDYATSNNIACVFCGYKSVTLDNINEYRERPVDGKVFEASELRKLFLERKLKLLVPGMLVQKDVYKHIGYDSECPYDEDIHFLWQILFVYKQFGYVSNQYYHYLNRSTSMVHNLKPDNYLRTSQCYRRLVTELKAQYPLEKKIINKIHPKYRLGGAHVLAKANDFSVFKQTVIEDGYRKEMAELIFQPNLKLSIYATLFCVSLKLFYTISR